MIRSEAIAPCWPRGVRTIQGGLLGQAPYLGRGTMNEELWEEIARLNGKLCALQDWARGLERKLDNLEANLARPDVYPLLGFLDEIANAMRLLVDAVERMP